MFSWDLYHKAPIVGILRHFSSEAVKRILENYAEAGLTTIEITMNTAGAEAIIKEACSVFGDTLNIGAGTVCNEKDLEIAINAGAKFIVTPVVEEAVIAKAVEAKIPIFPGAFTPTEIYKAWSLGGSMIKVFPATFFGPEYIKELKAPLNNIKLLPTGGVTLDNLATYFKKGADGVAMAGQLFIKEYIDDQDWKKLQVNFKRIENIYREYKNQLTSNHF